MITIELRNQVALELSGVINDLLTDTFTGLSKEQLNAIQALSDLLDEELEVLDDRGMLNNE